MITIDLSHSACRVCHRSGWIL